MSSTDDADRKAMEIYDRRWKAHMETDGVLDPLKVARELADFAFMLDEVPKVYMHVTGGRLSYPNYRAEQVIQVAREHNAEMIEMVLIDARAEWEIEREDGGA